MITVPDNYTLVLSVSFHTRVRIVTYGKYVWGHLAYFLVSVLLNLFSCVDGQNLIWIYCYQDGACVCLKVNNMINNTVKSILSQRSLSHKENTY